MSFSVSPAVSTNEIDATNVIPAVSSSIGAYSGDFEWGPLNEIVPVSLEKDIVINFGEPTNNTATSFFTAASFLKYGNALKIVRSGAITGSTMLNATSGHSGSQGLLIANTSIYDGMTLGTNTVGEWAARYPGLPGNGLSVSVCPASGTAFSAWTYKNLFALAPGTSAFAASVGASNDELHIVVVDASGIFTGTPGTVLETYPFLSQASDAVASDGTSQYYVNAIRADSSYLLWLAHSSVLTTAGQAAAVGGAFVTGSSILNYTFSGGTWVASTTGDVTTGLNVFSDPDTVDANLTFAVPDSGGVITGALQTLASNRKDGVVFLSAPVSATAGVNSAATQLSNVTTYHNTYSPSNSYTFLDSSSAKIYDKYNDVYRNIPLCGHIAGLCANTDNVAYPWYSPAGYNRGYLKDIVKLWYNPVKADRDTLYLARINPIVTQPGQGTLLLGDKTGQAKPSAFDRINVRRLFCTLEKAISTAAKYQLFEFNDQFTQAMFRNMTEPYLRNVQGLRGIIAFKVVCDSSNNTPEVIDENAFVGDIFIKPAKSINFINLNFIATRTGVAFSEIAGGTSAP